MLDVLNNKGEEIEKLSRDIAATFASGNKIFLCGCGATGRLSLSLETLWIEDNRNTPLQNSVVGFMAGGDVALIKSIENFEDRPDFGTRQLLELGFRDGDLLISTTEGGETPFVIGATESAAAHSHRAPYFLYCNPDDILCKHVERSRRVIQNPKIRKINLTVGPMAISGSTRMQASTILMMAVGLAMFGTKSAATAKDISKRVENLRNSLAKIDVSFLAKFITTEAETYLQKNHVTYTTDAYGITVLTDTTERSPTFSLAPFENQSDENRAPSLCYLSMPAASTQEEGWKILLSRSPRALNWEGITHIAGDERMRGFDISSNVAKHRQALVPNATHHTFSINRSPKGMQWRFQELEHSIPIETLPLLEEHILLKMLLNMHSTLVMGKLGRYHGNVMTWVRPSNYKLIDRSVRYVQFLLEEVSIKTFSYAEIVHACLEEFENLGPNEPVVLKVFETLKARTK
jgi:N-acetylmuramic acid 6-phosphate etherase